MTNLASFLRDDACINTAEFSARIYPARTRRNATTLASRLLAREREAGEARAEVREFFAAAQQQVQQLAADLLAGLRRPEGRPSAQADAGLVALASDPRLLQQAFVAALYPQEPASTARRNWQQVREGRGELSTQERRVLRTELQALAARCQAASK